MTRIYLDKHVSVKVATVEQAAAIAELLHDAGWDAWHEGGRKVCVACPDRTQTSPRSWMRPSDCRLLVLKTANRVDDAGEVRE